MHVNKPRANQFLTSEPKLRLIYATREILKIVQASFDSLCGYYFQKKLPILKENPVWELEV